MDDIKDVEVINIASSHYIKPYRMEFTQVIHDSGGDWVGYPTIIQIKSNVPNLLDYPWLLTCQKQVHRSDSD